MNDKPRVDKVIATYDRDGICDRCRRKVHREKTFRSTTLEGCETQAYAWSQTPLRHAGCE